MPPQYPPVRPVSGRVARPPHLRARAWRRRRRRIGVGPGGVATEDAVSRAGDPPPHERMRDVAPAASAVGAAAAGCATDKGPPAVITTSAAPAHKGVAATPSMTPSDREAQGGVQRPCHGRSDPPPHGRTRCVAPAAAAVGAAVGGCATDEGPPAVVTAIAAPAHKGVAGRRRRGWARDRLRADVAGRAQTPGAHSF